VIGSAVVPTLIANAFYLPHHLLPAGTRCASRTGVDRSRNVRPGGRVMFRKILNANEGSANAFKALEMACDLAAKYAAELHIVLVEEVPAMPDTDMIDEIAQIKAGEDKLVRAEIRRARSIAAP
jgi:hypothetical protein